MKKTFRSILVLALITAMLACLIVPVSAEEEILFEEPAQEEFFEFEEEYESEEEFYDEPEEEFVEEEPAEEEPVEEEPVEEEPIEEEPIEEEPAEEEPAVEEPTEEPSAEPAEEPTEEPSAEPTEEPTEAPAEEPAEQPEEEEPAEAEEEADSVEFDAELEVLLMNDEDVELFFGDEVTLQAVVYFANLDYVIRWEANANIDGVEEWFTVDETDTPFFTFELTEENVLWQYRATLVAVEDEAEA